MALAKTKTRSIRVEVPCPDCDALVEVQVMVSLKARDKHTTCDRLGCGCNRPPTGPGGEKRYVLAEAWPWQERIYHDCPEGRNR